MVVLWLSLLMLPCQAQQGTSPSPASATASPRADDTFAAANQKMRDHDYAGALALYKIALVAHPHNANLMYNASLAAYGAHDYDDAVTWLQEYRSLLPNDWHGLANLCQAQEAAGQAEQAEAVAHDLHQLWTAKTNEELSAMKYFVRDRFESDGKPVVVLEYFDPVQTGPAHVWDFDFVGANGKPERVYYVERDPISSKEVSAAAHTSVDLHFFNLEEPHRHTNFYRMQQRPTYEAAKKVMLDIMAGKYKPVSSTPH